MYNSPVSSSTSKISPSALYTTRYMFSIISNIGLFSMLYISTGIVSVSSSSDPWAARWIVTCPAFPCSVCMPSPSSDRTFRMCIATRPPSTLSPIHQRLSKSSSCNSSRGLMLPSLSAAPRANLIASALNPNETKLASTFHPVRSNISAVSFGIMYTSLPVSTILGTTERLIPPLVAQITSSGEMEGRVMSKDLTHTPASNCISLNCDCVILL